MDDRFDINVTAVVDPGARIGRWTRIWHFCHIDAGAVIGEKCTIGQGCYIAAGAVIGDGVKIQNNVSVFSGVTIESNVFVGPSVAFTNVSFPRATVNKHGQYEKTVVRNGATIGANATILCGITIGYHAFVAAGSVVTKDVPDFALVMGVPARVVRMVDMAKPREEQL